MLKRSSNPKKKWCVSFVKGDKRRTIHFGATGYSDYTQHKDKERRARYIARHQKRENFNDPFSAGFWAKKILWGETTSVRTNFNKVVKQYNLKKPQNY